MDEEQGTEWVNPTIRELESGDDVAFETMKGFLEKIPSEDQNELTRECAIILSKNVYPEGRDAFLLKKFLETYLLGKEEKEGLVENSMMVGLMMEALSLNDMFPSLAAYVLWESARVWEEEDPEKNSLIIRSCRIMSKNLLEYHENDEIEEEEFTQLMDVFHITVLLNPPLLTNNDYLALNYLKAITFIMELFKEILPRKYSYFDKLQAKANEEEEDDELEGLEGLEEEDDELEEEDEELEEEDEELEEEDDELEEIEA